MFTRHMLGSAHAPALFCTARAAEALARRLFGLRADAVITPHQVTMEPVVDGVGTIQFHYMLGGFGQSPCVVLIDLFDPNVVQDGTARKSPLLLEVRGASFIMPPWTELEPVHDKVRTPPLPLEGITLFPATPLAGSVELLSHPEGSFSIRTAAAGVTLPLEGESRRIFEAPFTDFAGYIAAQRQAESEKMRQERELWLANRIAALGGLPPALLG